MLLMKYGHLGSSAITNEVVAEILTEVGYPSSTSDSHVQQIAQTIIDDNADKIADSLNNPETVQRIAGLVRDRFTKPQKVVEMQLPDLF